LALFNWVRQSSEIVVSSVFIKLDFSVSICTVTDWKNIVQFEEEDEEKDFDCNADDGSEFWREEAVYEELLELFLAVCDVF